MDQLWTWGRGVAAEPVTCASHHKPPDLRESHQGQGSLGSEHWKALTPATTEDDRFRMVQMINFEGFLTHRFSNFLGSLHDQGFSSQKGGPEDIGFVLFFPNGFTYECG